MTKKYVDIAFIVPLLEEFNRLEAVFPRNDEKAQGVFFQAALSLGSADLTSVAFLQDDMGKAAASRATSALLDEYEVGVILIVGIAGGLSDDAGIGDICFTGTVIDVLENAKLSDTSRGGAQADYAPVFLNTDPLLTFSLKYCQLGADAKSAFEQWQLDQKNSALNLIPGEFIGRKGKNEVIGTPQIHDGNIVCGPVSKSEDFKKKMKSVERKVLAVETEAGGVFSIALAKNVPAVSIRGICDYADKNKKLLEEQTKNNTRIIAADNAVKFVAMQMKNPQFLRFLEQRRERAQKSVLELFEYEKQKDLVPSTLQKLDETIHQQLILLSPSYRGKPKGYRLPLPRVRSSQVNASVTPASKRADPVSMLEAIVTHRVILIRLPRNYPDNSLPWILASALKLIEIEGRQAIPMVIDGESIKPPHGTISSHSELDFEKLCLSEEVQPVIIITNFPGGSKPRLDFLVKEIASLEGSKFVIINRHEPMIAKENDLVMATGSERMDLCEISFAELTEFFQRTFEMADQEAGVTSLKMQAMFKKFKLDAHPTYFANVGTDVLSSLLLANRRTELIQIAVSGFLSFVVASDQSSINLSRTTREEFLRKLVFAKNVGKQHFDRATLIKFVEQFANTNDYDIDPIEFIRSFQTKGLIHFDDGETFLSLPFIECYLLASELAANPSSAVSYFDLQQPNFDFATFDIYSELGPAREIVDQVILGLKEAVSALKPDPQKKHILLTNEIQASMLEKPERLMAFQSRLQNAFDDVIQNRPNTAEKQALLDVASKMDDVGRAAQEKVQTGDTKEMTDANAAFLSSSKIWSIATLLLGCGSERLARDPKRELVLWIVRLASMLLDGMLRTFPKLEFAELKEKVETEEGYRQIFEIKDDEEIDSVRMELSKSFIEIYEFSLLSSPMRALLEALGNCASQPVLRMSVTSVEFSDPIENLLARIWSAEIDALREKNSLIKAIKEIPQFPFIRYSISTYLMYRVFWNHWNQSNRLALLDAAGEALQPLNGRLFEKGNVIRQIKAENKSPKTTRKKKHVR